MTRAGADARSMTSGVAQAAPARPAVIRALIAALGFLGLTALPGGIDLTFGLWMTDAIPPDWLDAVPLVDSWVAPGLVLGAGFGLGSLLTAYGVLRRPRWAWLAPVERLTGRHWSWAATVLIGLCMVVWIGLEPRYLPERSWLELIYGALGLALLGIASSPSVRRHLAR